MPNPPSEDQSCSAEQSLPSSSESGYPDPSSGNVCSKDNSSQDDGESHKIQLD
ncbi:hypothetical protein AbraIFM66950_012184, partial [Aspergillus brasiliensis]